MGREDEIRLIAYALWVQEGHSQSRAIRHWLDAEAIWEHNQKVVSPRDSPGEESGNAEIAVAFQGNSNSI
jgi:hypothetical protein